MMTSFQELIRSLFESHQGWFLTALSSLMCIIGASVIYLDVIVKLFNSRSTFDIKSNEKFLICGFSLSSGSLLFTSFYKLLPKAIEYFEKAIEEEVKNTETKHKGHGGGLKPSLSLMIYFFVGVVACELFNYLIHRFTSESIVHCNHDGDQGSEHNSEHSHSHGEHHSHSHSTSSDEDGDDKDDHHSHSHEHHDHAEQLNTDESSILSADVPRYYGSNDSQSPVIVRETSAVIPPQDPSTPKGPTRPALITQKRSFFDLAFGKLRNKGSSSQCIGIDDEDCEGVADCISDEITNNVSNDLHNLQFYRGLSVSKSKSSLVAYTSKPNLASILKKPSTSSFIGAGGGMGDIESHPQEFQQALELHHHHHHHLHQQQQQSKSAELIPFNHNASFRLSTETNLDSHQKHKDDHHHKVNTPISKLLAIGLQTCLALTLHKFPEGFITYATSKADPKLGISIFLSLAIHNIVEGFSMTLPLYLAFDSRFKAFTITFCLGGFSQPIGALMAYYLIGDREIDKNESFYIFGILMSITSGFLSIISLQLFASSINFGGKATTVIKWCMVGVFIIQLSNALTDYNS